MSTWLLVAVGGAAGSVARYGFSLGATRWLGAAFPFGTLGVNALGSFLAGLLYVLIVQRLAAQEEWRSLLLIGVLGGFTTFSAFSLETIRLLESGRVSSAAANIGLNLVFGLGACIAGLWLGRRLF